MHLICPPPAAPKKKKNLQNLCFSFFLGITAVPREIENNAYAKCLGLNKMHYGRCVSGELYCFFHFKLLSRYGFSACKRYILMFLGVNLSFLINCTKNVFFCLVSGATERKRQTSRQVCQVSILLRLQGVKVNRDNKNSNSNYNSMSNVR